MSRGPRNRSVYSNRSARHDVAGAHRTRLYVFRSRCIVEVRASARPIRATTSLPSIDRDADVSSSDGRFDAPLMFGHVASPAASVRLWPGIETLIVLPASTETPDVCFAKWTNGLSSSPAGGAAWKLSELLSIVMIPRRPASSKLMSIMSRSERSLPVVAHVVPFVQMFP